MTAFTYPLAIASALVERLDAVPAGTTCRRWVLRDDNQRQYHGVVPLAEDPACLELLWKPGVRGREQQVGVFRLHLHRLLHEGYVRAEGDVRDPVAVRLRFVRGDRSVILIQARDDLPGLPVGTVDLSMG